MHKSKLIKINRHERKFFVDYLNFAETENIIKHHPAIFSELYHQRFINNIYFDSFSMDNYYDNIEGVSERIKIRIRWYDNLFGIIEKPILEFKIKKGFTNKKISFQILPFELNSINSLNEETIFQIFKDIDNLEIKELYKIQIKFLKPTLLNRYKRKYFISSDNKFRITLDRDLDFYRLNSNLNSFNKFSDNTNSILELKYDLIHDVDANIITNYIPFRLTKSSKYVIGISKILE